MLDLSSSENGLPSKASRTSRRKTAYKFIQSIGGGTGPHSQLGDLHQISLNQISLHLGGWPGAQINHGTKSNIGNGTVAPQDVLESK